MIGRSGEDGDGVLGPSKGLQMSVGGGRTTATPNYLLGASYLSWWADV